MKTYFSHIVFTIVMLWTLNSSFLFSQVNMTVTSLADDDNAYPWDDPDTELDESRDGIVKDKSGRATLRAAIEESINMDVPAIIEFNVNGMIDLIDVLYPVDGSMIYGDHKIELKGDNCLEINNGTHISGFKFNATYSAISVIGNNNVIGPGNEFLNSATAIIVEGDSNFIGGNRIGIDTNDVLGPNVIGLSILGNNNTVGSNIICGNVTGISIAEGEYNEVRANYIGSNIDGEMGLGNIQGIQVAGSGLNLIGGDSPLKGNIISGNSVAGITISGVPPDNYSVDNYIWNNIIGMDFLAIQAVSNGNGIVITNGARIEKIQKNIIAGNSQSGIYIFGSDVDLKTYGHIITENQIGMVDGEAYPNGEHGISIWGNVEDVIIGTNFQNAANHLPNIISGNKGKGISILDDGIFSPSKITIRKNVIYQNASSNLSLSSSSNNGIQPPYSLSFNNNTIAGIHDTPGAIIDIYKSNINDVHPAAYAWIGSTTVGSNGIFSYEINDPSIESVSLTTTSSSGNTSGFGYLELITGVKKEEKEIPTQYSLGQNYPNPFNPTTTIGYQLPSSGHVTLKVYDALGREVAILVNEVKEAGKHRVQFNAEPFTSGPYFYTVQSGKMTATKKMMLLK